jgi:hypothetical protein
VRGAFPASARLEQPDRTLQTATVQLSILASCNQALSVRLKAIDFSRPGAGTGLAIYSPGKFIFGSDLMADIILIIVTVLFFAISWAYVRGCDRL